MKTPYFVLDKGERRPQATEDVVMMHEAPTVQSIEALAKHSKGIDIAYSPLKKMVM